MADVCETTQFTADPEVFEGTPLVLDEWLSLGNVNLTSVVVTLFDFDISVIGGEDGGVVGGEDGEPIGPE